MLCYCVQLYPQYSISPQLYLVLPERQTVLCSLVHLIGNEAAWTTVKYKKKIPFTAIRRRNTCWNSDLNWMEEMHELIHKTLLNGMGSCQWMLSTLRGVSASIVNKLFCTTSLGKMALNVSVPCLVLACNSTHNSISPLLYVVLPERQTVLCPLFFPVIVENDHRERGSSPPISFS